MPGANGPDEGQQQHFVPVLAEMKIVLFADGNWSYEAPIGNLPVCYTMVGMMTAELAAIQFERTRREGGQIVLPKGFGSPSARGPQGTPPGT